MAFPMPGIGILFKIDDLGGGHYGYEAWRIFMRNVSSEELLCCILVEGDTLRKIGGEWDLFCIGIYGLLSDFRSIREKFEALDEPGLAAMPSRVIEKAVLDSLPLPIHGSVDEFGRLVTKRWTRMDHDLCKEAGWGYAPEQVPTDLEEPLRSDLKCMKVDWPLEQVLKPLPRVWRQGLGPAPSARPATEHAKDANRNSATGISPSQSVGQGSLPEAVSLQHTEVAPSPLYS